MIESCVARQHRGTRRAPCALPGSGCAFASRNQEAIGSRAAPKRGDHAESLQNGHSFRAISSRKGTEGSSGTFCRSDAGQTSSENRIQPDLRDRQVSKLYATLRRSFFSLSCAAGMAKHAFYQANGDSTEIILTLSAGIATHATRRTRETVTISQAPVRPLFRLGDEFTAHESQHRCSGPTAWVGSAIEFTDEVFLRRFAGDPNHSHARSISRDNPSRLLISRWRWPGALAHPFISFTSTRASRGFSPWSTRRSFSRIPRSKFSQIGEIAGRLKNEMQRRFSVDVRPQHCHFRSGRPSPEICAVTDKLNADLVVIATHGRTGLKHLMLGSTAEKVIRHAHCPVLVVREATRGPIKTAAQGIVLEKSWCRSISSEIRERKARDTHRRFATRVGADLVLMNVTSPLNHTALDPTFIPPDWPELVETARLSAADKLDEMVNFLPLVGISAETEVAVGTPIEKLIERTEHPDIDMVITSTHGYTGLRHVLIGSTAEQRRAAGALSRPRRAKSLPPYPGLKEERK